jgi:L-lysine exporter family protein LysE/ArgO
VWFSALGFGARFLAPLFSTTAAWRVLDSTIAVTMATMAAALLWGGDAAGQML